MIALLISMVILIEGGASKKAVYSHQVHPCKQYKTMEGINYTLTTNNGSDTACVTGCLYMRDDGKEGNICVAKPANITIGKKQLKNDIISQLGGCPSHQGLTYNKKVIAGYQYYGVGSSLQELGCNGHMDRLYAGYSFSTDTNDLCFPFGSMVVNPGCKVIFFEDISMTTHHTYGQGIYSLVTKDMTFGKYIDHGIPCVSAYLASCDHTYPTCVPTDNWETVVELDNTQSITATTFTYKHTIGTTFSSETKESIGASLTIKEDVSANFFDLFSSSVGVSLTTNYDWTQTDTATKSEATTTEVSQKVRAGKRLSIQQAVGHCGGSTVNTILFKTISD